MLFRHLLFLLLFICAGCASFKTTVMQRASDSRFYPNMPQEKTKGVPVKLKVPTHVEVKIVESFLLHNAVGTAAAATLAKKNKIKAKADKAYTDLGITIKVAEDQLIADRDADELAKAKVRDLASEENKAKQVITAAKLVASQMVFDKVKPIYDAMVIADQEASDAQDVVDHVVPGYEEAPVQHGTVDIRNLSVVTKLCYTEKVFTVDFRRPAGGVLNLSGVAMDSQQYFAAVQADYQEQTLAQINAAIGTLSSGTQAPPISGGDDSFSPVASVEIQKSSTTTNTSPFLAADQRVVAMSRFDITDPDWEEQLHYFVQKHVTGCQSNCPVELCPVPMN